MATNTSNYNLIIATGDDLVNPLTQIFPNFTTIDGAMKNNKDAGITTATHVKSGTLHTLTRANADCPVFRFLATAPFTAGDTFYVDGVAYGAEMVDGAVLPDGAFANGSNVLCCVNSGVLTIYTSKFSQTDLTAYMKTSDYVGAEATSTVRQAEIAANASAATTAQTAVTAGNGENLYTETKAETVHNLVGSGTQGRFIATSNYVSGDTFTVNGIPYNIVTNNGEPLPDNFFVTNGGIRFFLASGNIYFF